MPWIYAEQSTLDWEIHIFGVLTPNHAFHSMNTYKNEKGRSGMLRSADASRLRQRSGTDVVQEDAVGVVLLSKHKECGGGGGGGGRWAPLSP